MRVDKVRIWQQYLADHALIDIEAITEAALNSAPVGNCSCGAYLRVPAVPACGWAGRGPVWVNIECPACGREIAAPDGRLERLRRGA